jgi:hypothetical protein
MTDQTFKQWCEELSQHLCSRELVKTKDTGTVRRPRFIPGLSHAQTRRFYNSQRRRLVYHIMRFAP